MIFWKGMSEQMNKKFSKAAAAALCCAVLMPSAVLAQSGSAVIKAAYKDIKIYIDNEKTTLKDASGNIVEPFICDGTTYLPLRAVAETLNMNVGWDGEKNVITLDSGADAKEKTAEIYNAYIGEKELEINYRDIKVLLDGSELTLKSADGKVIEPFIYDGTTYLPLRAVAETTGAEVEWDGATNSIYLSVEDDEPAPEKSTYDLSKTSDWTIEEAQKYGYTLDFDAMAEKDYVKLVKYEGEEKNVLIPAKIAGKSVYMIGTSGDVKTELFAGNTNIEYVSFENGVVLGGLNYMFSGCKNLKGVYNVPATAGIAACFYGCEKLSHIDGDFSRVTSASSAFYGCKRIESVPEMGREVRILSNAFVNCENLSGDIKINSAQVSKAENIFKGTKKPITVSVLSPSSSYDALTAEELPENVTLTETENRIAYLPKEIDVASFTSINLYNYGVAPEYLDCDIKWDCEVGTASNGKFTITGTEENVGKHPISVTISKDGRDLYTAKSTVNIVSTKNIPGKMVLTCVGDPYTTRKEWRTRIGRYSERISFVGTRSSTHEGRTGANTEYYLNAFTYTADQNGLDKENPFFNPETETFDWNYYKQHTGLSPTGVQLFFQNYTSKTTDENVANIKTMVDAIQKDAPDMRIFVVQPACLAAYSDIWLKKNFEYAMALEDAFADYENVYMISLNMTYDRDINRAANKTPNEEGYNQWGDCMFGVYAAALSK